MLIAQQKTAKNCYLKNATFYKKWGPGRQKIKQEAQLQVFPHGGVKTCSFLLFRSQIESGKEDYILSRHIVFVFLIPPSIKLLASMCPLHRCAYSLTWLDGSLHLLITSNGWLVPTKVWGFLINSFCLCFCMNGCGCIWVVRTYMWVLRVSVCVHACPCAGSDSFCQEAVKWHLGGVRGRSALIPLPVRVSPSWLLTADGSHVSTLHECPLEAKVRKTDHRVILERQTPPPPPFSYRHPLWNNLTGPVWASQTAAVLLKTKQQETCSQSGLIDSNFRDISRGKNINLSTKSLLYI